MIAVDAWCTPSRGARLIMQVHDELVLEVEETRLAEVTAAVRERMMGAASLRVPLKVDAGSGANWDQAH
jgi:DNA polymerase-1